MAAGWEKYGQPQVILDSEQVETYEKNQFGMFKC